MPLELFLSHDDTHAPTLAEGLPPEAADDAPKPAIAAHDPDAGNLADSNFHNSLLKQRWGLIVPRGEIGKELLRHIAPLQKLREEQQGAAAIVYEVDPGMSVMQSNEWISKDYQDRVERRESLLPRYLLILGGPELVSWELQQMLGTECFVGRLAFSDASGGIDHEGYEAYVAKVLRWERPDPVVLSKAPVLFYTVQDKSGAVKQGATYLMAPSLSITREDWSNGEFPAQRIDAIGEAAYEWGELTDALEKDAQAFLEKAASAQAGLLFSMSHGAGAPSKSPWSPAEQRARQGMMKMGGQDAEAQLLSATQKGSFLPGGFWLYFACFGGGTPATSAYYSWLVRLKELGKYSDPTERLIQALPRPGEPPFVAALPQAALRNPNGPLGVVGHVDLAWSWSFLDDAVQLTRGVKRGRHERFQGILKSLAVGGRFGAAHHTIARYAQSEGRRLLDMYDSEGRGEAETAVTKAKKADVWMQRADLCAYVLLGDPAARLPIGQDPGDLYLK